jgi:hypothetical protein
MSVHAASPTRGRPPEIPWAIACVLLGLVAWGVAVAVDRAQLTPTETIDSLASAYRGSDVAGLEISHTRTRRFCEAGVN